VASEVANLFLRKKVARWQRKKCSRGNPERLKDDAEGFRGKEGTSSKVFEASGGRFCQREG
jgi:hypothetical protein